MSIENKRFKAVREALSLTQQKFAEELGISTAAVRKIENESTNLGINHAITIHEKFGYSLDYLYGFTDSTNDEASTMLLYLRKIFHYQYDAKMKYPFTVKVSQPVIDFLKSISKADELLDSGMPQEAYDIWLNQLKKDFNEKMDGHTTYADSPETIYKMVPARDLVRLDPKPS